MTSLMRSARSGASASGQKTTGSTVRPSKSPSPPRGSKSPSSPAKSKSKSPPPSKSYDVYRVEYIGEPNHVAIFVETQKGGQNAGVLYHVTGNILMGMTYEQKPAKQPEQSATFVSKTLIGTISTSISTSKDGEVDTICRSVNVPGRQLKLNGQRINPNLPVRRCGEWVNDAIQLLRARNVLRN